MSHGTKAFGMHNLEFHQEAQKKIPDLTRLERRFIADGGKLAIGEEQREGWSGKLPFYLFQCEVCGRVAKDYPHGFIHRQYLICSGCGMHHSFVPWWAPLVELWDVMRLYCKHMFTRKVK